MRKNGRSRGSPDRLAMSLSAHFNFDVSGCRAHNPVRVDFEARVTLPEGQEHACRIVEMSTGEIVFFAPVQPRYGDRVVAYVPELGRFEGDVEREVEGGFAISLWLTEARRRRLAAQLVWFANRDFLGLPDSRRHRRIVPRMQWTRVRHIDGSEQIAEINDFSLCAISVDSPEPVALGERVAFGVKAAIVNRLFEGGFVAEFEEPFNEGEIDETTRF
ncbi:MAG: pilus assembly protein PilZ [Methylocystis sp.]|nr:MAG: pilus assembly protein PilZ [Methylocystis sp.]